MNFQFLSTFFIFGYSLLKVRANFFGENYQNKYEGKACCERIFCDFLKQVLDTFYYQKYLINYS